MGARRTERLVSLQLQRVGYGQRNLLRPDHFGRAFQFVLGVGSVFDRRDLFDGTVQSARQQHGGPGQEGRRRGGKIGKPQRSRHRDPDHERPQLPAPGSQNAAQRQGIARLWRGRRGRDPVWHFGKPHSEILHWAGSRTVAAACVP